MATPHFTIVKFYMIKSINNGDKKYKQFAIYSVFFFWGAADSRVTCCTLIVPLNALTAALPVGCTKGKKNTLFC